MNILEQGAQGLTTPHPAAEGGHLEVFQLLFDSGADVNVADYEDCVVLERMAPSGCEKVVKMFLGDGVSVEDKKAERIPCSEVITRLIHSVIMFFPMANMHELGARRCSRKIQPINIALTIAC